MGGTMKNTIIVLCLLGWLLSGCIFEPVEVTTKDMDYEITCRLPVRWEKRLDNWDEWLLPPEGQRFVWVYCRTQSLSTEPRLLRRKDFQMGYTLGDSESYTTTLVARGNNDIYMWAPDWDIIHGGLWNYGGVTGADGFGDRYVFAVPRQAENFVLEISDMPPLELSR